MRRYVLKIFITLIFLIGQLSSFAQSGYVEWTDPTCPDPSNGKAKVKISKASDVASGSFDVQVLIAESGAYKTSKFNIPVVSGQDAYEYDIPLDLPFGVEIIVIVKAPGENASFILEQKDGLNKPEYSAHIGKGRDAGCENQPVGIANVTFNAGLAPYTWQWFKCNDASFGKHDNAEQVTDLDSGKYYVTVSDFGGCKINSDTLQVKTIDVEVSAAIIKNILCKDMKEGSASASVTNAYKNSCTIIWDNISHETATCDASGNASAQNDKLPAGNLFVAVEDEIGCRDTTTIEITEPENKIAIALESSSNLLCKDVPTGSASFSATNAIEPSTYTWSDGGEGASRNDLAANIDYKVVITDANGCKDSTNIELTEPDTKVEVSEVSHSEPKCYGGSDGEIEVTATGGNSGVFTYTWNGASANAKNSNIQAGEWEIIATDENGCKDTLNFTLDQPEKIGSEFIFTEDGEPADNIVACNGDEVTVTVNVTGGVLPIKYYKWNDGAESSTTSITSKAGECKVVMEDSNGCMDSVLTTIVEPEKLNLGISEKTPIACKGYSGEIEVVPTGGTEPYSYNWSTGSTTALSGDVKVGSYSVNVTDVNGCKTSETYEIQEPDSIKAKIQISAEACKDISTGNLYVNIDGGTSPFQYVWNNGSTNTTLDGLKATTYHVAITDANGCTDYDTVNLANANKFSLGWTTTSVKCKDGADGSATVKIKNGFSPYTVKWNTGNTVTTKEKQHKLTNLPKDIYHVIVVDDRGCELSTDPEVKLITPIQISKIALTVTACTEPTGTATATVKNGTLPYTYLWTNGNKTKKNTGMAEGDYTLTVTDANGCVIDTTITIKKKATLEINAISTDTTIRCENGTTGTATAIAASGVEPYTFKWSNGATTETVENLAKGTYSVTVTDNEGCEASDEITFIEDDILTIIDKEIHAVTCYGGNDGFIAIGIEGGVAPYEISWSNGSTAYTNQNLTEGTYTVTVTDATGCSVTQTYTITQGSPITISIDGLTSIQCVGECNASAQATAEGGIAPYTYEWSSKEFTDHASALCYGEQSVIVTDAEGCAEKKTFTVDGRTDRLMLSSVTPTLPICGEGTPSGIISVTPTGSINGSYTYAWSTNGTEFATTKDISGLTAGAYTLLLTDGTCTFDTTITIGHQLTATAEFERLSSNCDGESYQINISNESTANYTYLWSNGETTKVAHDLTDGTTYSVEATDKNNCVLSQSITIAEKKIAVAIDTKEDANCYGKANGSASAITENMEGTVTYTWYNSENTAIGNTNTITGLAKGNYHVTAYDANHADCPVTADITIEEPAQMQLFFAETEPSYCKKSNGSATVDIVGGQAPYTYKWTDKNGTIVGTQDTVHDILANDLYVVTITDNVGCEISGQTSISDISNFSLQGLQTAPITCKGRSDAELQVFTNNGYAPFTYKWSHNASEHSAIAKTLGKGTYSVSVVDSKGCTASYEFEEVKEPQPLTVSIDETPQITCKGGTGNMMAQVDGGTGPYHYEWYSASDAVLQSSNDPELTGRFAGTYTVVVTDSYNCPSEKVSHTMEDPTELEATFNVKVTECGSRANVGEITLDTITGGITNGIYRFRWGTISESGTWTDFETEENRTLSNLEAGEYICTITNATNPESCYITKSLYTYPSVPESIVTNTTHARCNYYATTDNAADGEIEITEIFISEGDYTSHSSANLSDYTFLWNDAKSQTNPHATQLSSGNYEVTVTGSNECSKTFDAGSIEANINLNATIYSVNDTTLQRKEICFEDSLEVAIDTKTTYKHGYVPSDATISYEWTSQENNVLAAIASPNEEQTWVNPLSVYYSDSTEIVATYMIDGCQSKPARYNISHYDSVNFAIEVYDELNNYVGIDSVLTVKNATYLFNPTEEPWFVNQIGENGITSIFWRSFDIEMLGKGTIPDTATNKQSYDRSGLYGLQTIVDEANYIYAVATTTHGCKEKSSVFVNVYASVFVPTGFSPNGDGTNDTWVIPYLSICPNAVVTVFNRWGSKVYECKKGYADHPWDGRAYNGNELPMGTYYYVIEYNDENNTPTKTGSVSILR